jgi:hypothetical protein
MFRRIHEHRSPFPSALRVLACAGLIVLTAGCTGGENAEEAGGAARSLLLVTVENWGDAEPGQGLTASSLEGFTRFDDVMLPSPQLRPTIGSLLTGLAPDRHGADDDRSGRLADTLPTLATVLAGQGRATAAFVGNPLLDRRSGLDRGFEIYDQAPSQVWIGPRRFFRVCRTPSAVAQNATVWLDSVTGPFFAWVHLVGPGDFVLFGDGGTPTAPQPVVSWRAALGSLLSAVSAREDVVVVVAGANGRLDPSDAERSGYFLVPSVLKTSVLVRDASGEATSPAVAWLPDVPSLALREVGVQAALGEGPAGDEPGTARFAWTWRGAREMGWYPETAVVAGDVMLVREGTSGDLRSLSWSTGAPSSAAVDDRLVALLDARAISDDARHSPAVSMPDDLRADMKTHDLAIVDPPTPYEVSPRAKRIEALGAVLRGRRQDMLEGDWEGALSAFRAALESDPSNRGARQDIAEGFVLGRARLGRKSLDAILASDPYNPDAWHILGHVAHRRQDYARADTLWRLTDLLRPDDPDVLYDLACTRSLLEEVEDSLSYLERAWAAGFRSVDYIENDSDLRNLRADARFSRFMSEVVR